MNEFNYKNLTPFKWFVLENFPFIEADFDALTEWQLFCKLGKEINTIINSTNTLGTQVETLTDYVSNYFNNLNVQDEINNKLNQMAEDGTLQEIITSYLNVKGVLAFNNVNDMKNATNLINGSTCKTLGNVNYLDGQGSFYKIRNITNDDIIDNINIIPLNNSNILIAEKIPFSNNYEILKTILNQRNRNSNRKFIFIGDSYAKGTTNTSEFVTSWVEYCANNLNITQKNYYKFAENGSGFVRQGTSGNTFITLLQNNINSISNNEEITDIVVCGGVNDNTYDYSQIQSAMINFINYCKQNFINARIYFGMISNVNYSGNEGMNVRTNINNKLIRLYQLTSNLNGAYYLNGVEKIMKYYNFLSEDNLHPNENGYKYLGAGIAQAIITGSVNWSFTELSENLLTNSNILNNNFKLKMKIFDNLLYICSDGGSIEFNNPVNENNGTIQLGNLLSPEYFRKNIGNTFAVNISAVLYLQGGNTYSCPVMLNIDNNNNVYIRTYGYRENGSGKLIYTNVKRIELSAFNLSIPLLLS